MTWLPDLRPRLQLDEQPLWPCDIIPTADYSTVYVQLAATGSVLVVRPEDLFDPDEDVELVIGTRVMLDSNSGDVSLQDAERTLRLDCLKDVLEQPMLVAITLPEGNRIVWEFEQVEELNRRRLAAAEASA